MSEPIQAHEKEVETARKAREEKLKDMEADLAHLQTELNDLKNNLRLVQQTPTVVDPPPFDDSASTSAIRQPIEAFPAEYRPHPQPRPLVPDAASESALGSNVRTVDDMVAVINGQDPAIRERLLSIIRVALDPCLRSKLLSGELLRRIEAMRDEADPHDALVRKLEAHGMLVRKLEARISARDSGSPGTRTSATSRPRRNGISPYVALNSATSPVSLSDGSVQKCRCRWMDGLVHSHRGALPTYEHAHAKRLDHYRGRWSHTDCSAIPEAR
ncbi:hypothetical protein BKA93DRAFT_770302 [Sparassis latifolia]